MGVLGHAVLGWTVLGQSDDWPTGASSVSDELGHQADSRRYTLGDVVVLRFEVRDEDGDLADPGGASIEVTHESGASDDMTADLVHVETGRYQLAYAPALTGRSVAVFTATGDYAGTATVIFDVDPAGLAFVPLADLRTYLGASGATDAEILDALTVEQNDQADWCRIDPYTPALREALKRRVARNLHARRIQTAPLTSYGQGVTGVVATTQLDAEIARLEASRRLPGFA